MHNEALKCRAAADAAADAGAAGGGAAGDADVAAPSAAAVRIRSRHRTVMVMRSADMSPNGGPHAMVSRATSSAADTDSMRDYPNCPTTLPTERWMLIVFLYMRKTEIVYG